MNDLKDKIFDKYFVKCEPVSDICKDLNIIRKEFAEIAKQIENERKEEILEMRRIRTLYHNKKNLKGYKFGDFYTFYFWYLEQYKAQKGKCYYCETEEEVLRLLFTKKYTNSKRSNRGKHLEIERKDPNSNDYSKENCVLACYFCNNDKSDIFSEDEYRDYLKNRKEFFRVQFEQLK